MRLVSLPITIACSCVRSHRLLRYSSICVEFVNIVHAFCNGSPTQPARTDVKPCMHPSKRVLFKLCCLMNRLTLSHFQYMHDVGHSMAILQPSSMHLFATTSKFFQIAWKIFLCFKFYVKSIVDDLEVLKQSFLLF